MFAPAGDVNGDGYDDVVTGSSSVAAYVFLGSSAGLASTSTTLSHSGDYFGSAVASAGDVNGDGYDDVIVGAYGYSSSTGRAYVYLGSATGISTSVSTTLSGASSSDYFGFSVSSAGDVNFDGFDDVIVGAYGNDSGGTSAGRAYVYLGSSTGVSTTASTTLTGGGSSYYFGYSVGTAGDVDHDTFDEVVVGAYGYSSTKGRAYVYAGSSTGTNSAGVTTLTGDSSYDAFGFVVAGAGDVNGDGYADVLVGEPYYNSTYGRVYIYTGSLAGLNTTAWATDSGSSTSSSYLGYSAAGAGDTNGDGYDDIVSGAYYYDNSAGRAFVSLGGASGITESTIETGTHGDSTLGTAVSGAGDVNGDGYGDVVISASGYNSNTGRAYVYHGSASGLPTTANTVLTGSSTSTYLGSKVARAGDVNNDGYDDILVAATSAVYLYKGSSTGVSTSSSTTFSVTPSIIGSAGDVNGDGYDDVMIAYSTSYLYIYKGTSTAPSSTYTTRLSLSASSVASAGDINSDGYDDVIVGTTSYSSYTGEAFLYKGSSSGLSSTAATTIYGYNVNDYFGCSVAGVGDTNGDGYDDVVIGAYGYNGYEGRVYVYDGSSSSLTSVVQVLTGAAALDQFGYKVVAVGDTDADGYADLVVDGYRSSTNTLSFYQGTATGIASTASETFSTTSSVWAVANDVNGDDIPEILTASSSGYGSVSAYYGFVDDDGDGFGGANDCDDTDPAITVPYTAYADTDGDGYGDLSSPLGICAATAGYVANSTDCDDSAGTVHPGASEVCNASNSDEDCDGYADDNDPDATGQTTAYRDVDSDGYGGTTAGLYCDLAPGWVATSTDCDDADSAVHGPETLYADADGDSYGDASSSASLCTGASGYVADATDCDDASASAHPAGVEICDASNADEDCDGVADDSDPSATGLSTYYVDADTDGYGGTVTTLRCDAGSGYASTSSDCDDGNAAISPAGTERCDTSNADDDCDGLADDLDAAATGKSTFYYDSDGDEYGGATSGSYCDAPSGYVPTSTDCDDSASAIHPGATEVCDADDTDEDCDSLADDADSTATGKSTFYVDSDGDGYGSTRTASRCDATSGYSANSTDCDDADAGDSPGAVETVANGDDEDCDSGEICYVDSDRDGYRGSTTIVSGDADCSDAGEALETAAGDCDDTDAAVHSGGAEVVGDGIDEDCDGQELCYADGDGDGYRPDDTTTVASTDEDCDDAGEAAADALVGDCDDTNVAFNPAATEANCSDPSDYNCDGSVGYADADGDGFAACEECDDGNTGANPDATEVCNNLDDDCDGDVDTNAVDKSTWYADADGDGFTDADVYLIDCFAPDGYAAQSAEPDCDDSDDTAHPGAVDTPDDGVDQDCDGSDAVSDSGDDSGSGNGGNGGNGGPQDDTGNPDTDKGTGCGCATEPTSGFGSALGVFALGALLTRRRRA